MLKQYLLAGAAVLAVSSAAWAQETDLNLETISVVGLRPEPVDDVTSSVSVLTADDLTIRRSPNVADQLRAVPGVGISRSGGVGALSQVRLRGAEANHTLVLLDGIEVSDPVNGETDFGLLTGIGATRIEVLRGEASSIYGSDAIGGVVSLSTEAAEGVQVFGEVGTQDTARASATFSGQTGALRFGAGLSGFTTGGVDVAGLGGEADGSDAFSGIARAALDLNADWTLSGLTIARRSKAALDSDTDYDGLLDNTDQETEADQYLIGASLAGVTGQVDHVFRASFNEVARENTKDGAKTDESTGERLKASWSPSITFGNHELIGLVDYEKEDYDRTDVAYGGQSDASESFESLGLAAEYRVALGAFDLSASGRFDDNDGRFDDAATWRVGAGYGFDAVNGRAKASVGTGVKNPTFTELFGFFTGSFIGNPELKPEQSTSWEIGWDQQVGPAVLSATYFQADLEDEIYTAFDVNYNSTALNRAGKSKRSGVELSGRWDATSALSFAGQATFLQSEGNDGGDEIRVPDSTASLSVDWRSDADGIRVGAALDFVGEQDDFDFGSYPSRRLTLDAYTLFSASLEFPLTERMVLTLRGENLFDETATDVYGYEAPGAAAFIGLKLR
ncbi:TonB-dependent receptor plug domain-containing protein [Hyphomonas sp.]|jgi:vitamin B12 transporter|uniref:TonB-dependent receptor plug domain-containing protein n=1 Tax=Hyphomonas sp. TaxID=87 RepID=UPI0039E56807